MLTRIWNGLKTLVSLILPIFGKSSLRGVAPVLRWVLHLLILAGILALLWYLNRHFDLEKALRSPFPALHRVWLPLLFLIVYALAWMGYWLWRLLGPEHLSAEFPDIDAAWEEATAQLRQANLDLTEMPLFLVLGRPLGGEAALFSAAQMPWALQQSPRRPEAPLHLYASRDAIFLTCAESSPLGRQARLMGAAPSEAQTLAAALLKRLDEEVQTLLAAAQGQGRNPDQLNEEEKERLGDLQSRRQDAQAQAEAASSTPLLKNKPMLDELRARLEYVCRLILRERRPYCPINGVLVLVPSPALRGDTEAAQVANLVQADLQVARDTFQLECPCVLLITDLQQAPGFREFLEDASAAEREMGLGQSFPLLPDVDSSEAPAMLEQGISWFCRRQVFAALLRRFRLEPSQGEAPGRPGAALRNNFRLFQFWDFLRQARKRLARLAQRAAHSAPDAPPLVGGAFLAATGEDAATQQAFVPAVLRLLLRQQNAVAWTPQALVEERGFIQLTRAGYVVFLMLLLSLGGVGWWMWQR